MHPLQVQSSAPSGRQRKDLVHLQLGEGECLRGRYRGSVPTQQRRYEESSQHAASIHPLTQSLSLIGTMDTIEAKTVYDFTGNPSS